MKDIISVVVPIYNVESFLPKCIESICNQTYIDLDIVLVNDGSTDMCGRICDEYRERDSRIQVIHKLNSGVARTREVGIRQSKGNYLTFVDADDYIANDFCEKLIKKINEYDVDWVATNFKEVGGNYYSCYDSIQENELIIDKEKNIRNYIEQNFYTYVIWGKLFKRHLFENYQFQNLKIGEDTCCMIDIMMKTESAYLYNYSGYYYVSHGQAVTKSKMFNVNEYDRWKAQKYISDIVGEQFPSYAPFLRTVELNKFISVYQNTVVSHDKDLKRYLRNKLSLDVKEICLRDPMTNKRMKMHVFLIRYLNFLYDFFCIVKMKLKKQ